MDPVTSIKLAELRQHELRVDAARARRARLAREAKRARRRSRLAWRERFARRWRRRHTVTAPAPTRLAARTAPFDELANRFAAEGSAALGDELTRFVELAAASGATPTLLSILADDDQPDVVRQRAFARIVGELTGEVRGSADQRSGKSDAA